MDRLRLEQIIRDHGDKIYTFCLYLTKGKSEAEDLYQDTFLKAIELDEMDFSKNPKSYLLGIAVNIWRNRRRKNFLLGRKFFPVPIEDGETERYAGELCNPEALAEKDEIKLRVHTAVNSLGDRYRIIVLMYYREDMSVAQIAEVLNIPQGTVKSRLHKARNLIEKQLEDLI